CLPVSPLPLRGEFARRRGGCALSHDSTRRIGMPFRKPGDKGARQTDVTETMVAGRTAAPTTIEWNADQAVTQLYSEHYRPLVRLAALLVRDRSEEHTSELQSRENL